MYRKQVMEEAKQRAEQGIEEGTPLSTPSYALGSPEYTASTPVYGTSLVGQYQPLGFGAAAAASVASAAGLTPSPVGSPQYTASSPQYTASSPQYTSSSPQYSSIISPVGSPMVLTGQPTNVIFPTNPLQAVMPMGVGAQSAQAPQGMLSVEKQPSKEESKEGEGQGKKTVMVNLGQPT
jgi:DNA-directed RNA polymerase II subunit RPB1